MTLPICQAAWLAPGTGRTSRSASEKSLRYQLRLPLVASRAALIAWRPFMDGLPSRVVYWRILVSEKGGGQTAEIHIKWFRRFLLAAGTSVPRPRRAAPSGRRLRYGGGEPRRNRSIAGIEH